MLRGLDGTPSQRSDQRARKGDRVPDAEAVDAGEGHVLPDPGQAPHPQLGLVGVRREKARVHRTHGRTRIDVDARDESQLGRKLFENIAQNPHLVGPARSAAG